MKIEPGHRLFPFHRYRSLFIKLLIFIGTDVLILSGLTLWFKLNPDFYIFQGAVYQSLVIVNLGLAIACRFAAPKFYLPLLINSILSVLVFCLIYRLLG